MLQGKAPIIYGDGEQTRSVCYIDDLLNGLVKLMNNNVTNGPINLGNPRELTIQELANEIKKLTNSTSTISYEPLPLDDPMKRNPDISKAKNMLDWEPIIGLEEGIQKTIDYFMEKI